LLLIARLSASVRKVDDDHPGEDQISSLAIEISDSR
jgi:hypothetical protein